MARVKAQRGLSLLLLVMWEEARECFTLYVRHKAHFAVSFSYQGKDNQVVCVLAAILL